MSDKNQLYRQSFEKRQVLLTVTEHADMKKLSHLIYKQNINLKKE